jgi:hypothetical protein
MSEPRRSERIRAQRPERPEPVRLGTKKNKHKHKQSRSHSQTQ